MNIPKRAARGVGLSLSLSVLAAGTASGYVFEDFRRWSRTATDGSPGFDQGDPTTLTWSIVPDGTTLPNGLSGTMSSDLIDFLDGIRGAGPGGSDLTLRPWYSVFEQSFERYNQLSGLTLIYEPNDDGIASSSSFNNRGILGTRGDVRIGGGGIDGQTGSNTLAFNSFPNNGDMVIDTDNTSFYSGASNNSRGFRNVVMHEFGHGLGISHVESDASTSVLSGGCSCAACCGVREYQAESATTTRGGQFLMEPFISTSFDGPQLDDILAIHRGYGDVYEKSNGGQGNNSAVNATNLGTLNLGIATRIGTDANDTFVAPTDIDFVSIDDNSDIDFFKFTIDQAVYLDLTLTPKGPTYNSGAEEGAQSPLNTSALSDLTLSLIDTNGSTVLETSNSAGLGGTEFIIDFELTSPGEYFAMITGADNAPQFYQLDLFATAIPLLLGDLNGDFVVDEADLAIVLGQFGQSATPGSLVGGDPSGDGLVNIKDLNLVLANWTGSSPPPIAVPEPGSLAMLGLGGLLIARRRRRSGPTGWIEVRGGLNACGVGVQGA